MPSTAIVIGVLMVKTVQRLSYAIYNFTKVLCKQNTKF